MAVFVGNWSIGSGMSGGQSLNLHLTVGTENGMITGQAEMYFDFPGKSFRSAVVGYLTSTTIPGSGNGYIFTLHGTLPVANGPENLRATLTLGPEMKTGTGTYTYLDNETGWKTIANEKARFEAPPGPDIYTTPSDHT